MSASAAATVLTAAQKAQTFANQTAETARTEVIKEPLGFIKILQFFLALLAFATAVSGGSDVSFNRKCLNTSQPVLYKGKYNYPYNLKNAPLKPQTIECLDQKADRYTIATETNNIVSSAQFFVFTGVTAFLYSIAVLIIYIFFRHKYNNIVYLPLIDFSVTCIFTIFWFAGSIAWSKAVGDLQHFTDTETIIETMIFCKKNNNQNLCSGYETANYANLIVSCILGFGNLIVWAGDIWFVLKETSWYKLRASMRQQSTAATNNPISPNEINITAHYNPNDKI
ncbi:synaptoporin [Brachionus plicatilis]|uniref:Synaptoporin n=1 Tax=Brachionus plicatilis TaxID=10195 RepID=A0A3M7RJZ7_BRAPC|nr:synaptoporin [Brachionus plicatilis]